VKFWYLILVCCVWPAQQAAAACVFSGNLSVFEPGIAQLADDPSLPAPELESLDVTRGLNGGASCDQMGFMSVKLRWPRGSRFDLNDFAAQLGQMKKMGGLSSLMDKLPAQFQQAAAGADMSKVKPITTASSTATGPPSIAASASGTSFSAKVPA